MYHFLPTHCRKLFTMKMPSQDIVTNTHCPCLTGCADCYGKPNCNCIECREPTKKGKKKKRNGHVRKGVEERVVWEEAKVIPSLFDLFADNNLLNVVFDWEVGPRLSVTVSRARLDFQLTNWQEVKECSILTEETLPLPGIDQGHSSTTVYDEQPPIHRAEVTPRPYIALDLSLSFAFEDEVIFETPVEEFVRVTSVRGGRQECDLNRCRVTRTEVREECNVRTKKPKHPKYFCRSCSIDICKTCLQSGCVTHDVQWIGNQIFSCKSPHHRFSSCF